MPTTVTFYQEPTNLDYLMPDARMQFGDLTGDIFSDPIVRTSLVSAVRFLQRKWDGKYQIFSEDAIIDPQPSDVPTGYQRISSLHGRADVPLTIVEGSIFRDPYAAFTSESTPLIESIDEQAIIFAAVYLMRKAQISSSATDFLAWGTEDIRYNNLGSERGLSKLLENDLKQLNDYLSQRIAKPRRSEFPITYIPRLTEIELNMASF